MTIVSSAVEAEADLPPVGRLGVVLLAQKRPGGTPGGELADWLPDGTLIEEFGALDGVKGVELDAIRARPEDDRVLVAGLANGEGIVLSEERLLPYLERAIERAEEGGEVVLLSCTGTFPPLEHDGTLLLPDAAIQGVLGAAIDSSTHLGVICPLPEQMSWVRQKYMRWPTCSVATAPPRGASAVPMATQAGQDLLTRGADAIILDCMGYTSETAKAVKDATGLPVFLARRLAARVAAELV